MSLTGTARIQSSIRTINKVTGDLEDASSLINIITAYNFSSGSGNNQATTIWSDERTLSSTSFEAFDLRGGIAMVNVAGETITFTAIKMMYIENRHATASSVLKIGAIGNNPWDAWAGGTSPQIIIRGGFLQGTNPGGSIMLVAPDAAGYAVVDSSSDQLIITNDNATSLLYRIVLIGI